MSTPLSPEAPADPLYLLTEADHLLLGKIGTALAHAEQYSLYLGLMVMLQRHGKESAGRLDPDTVAAELRALKQDAPEPTEDLPDFVRSWASAIKEHNQRIDQALARLGLSL